ncbi:hypothetical protein [Mycolicibacterium bacteremicum]|uniref:hypothetical protein n=1 Tax=Mycolicibacterium bacteremicum TaxID=564198 RepID=UPI0026ED2FC8|nr:hypothetical protein [Mycolicibacterium bacteremicum]
MIFNDRVNVTLKEKKFVGGTQTTVTVFSGDVPAIVTFLDSATTFDAASAKVSSRLRIFLSPFAFAIPPMPASGLVALTWKQFTSLTIDGMVEPHYQNGRLHHYEILAKAV